MNPRVTIGVQPLMRRCLKRLGLFVFLAGGFLSALLLLVFAAAAVRLIWKGDQVVIRPYTKASYMVNSTRWALRFDWMPPDYLQGTPVAGPDGKQVNAPWYFRWSALRSTSDGMSTDISHFWWRRWGVQAGETHWMGPGANFSFINWSPPNLMGWYVSVPLPWGVVFAPWPAACLWWLARRWRQRRRRGAGCCVRCGYDLRGSPGACPECGWGTAGAGV
jgi:hypothetical protein